MVHHEDPYGACGRAGFYFYSYTAAQSFSQLEPAGAVDGVHLASGHSPRNGPNMHGIDSADAQRGLTAPRAVHA
jgi:hypothetical protein